MPSVPLLAFSQGFRLPIQLETSSVDQPDLSLSEIFPFRPLRSPDQFPRFFWLVCRSMRVPTDIGVCPNKLFLQLCHYIQGCALCLSAANTVRGIDCNIASSLSSIVCPDMKGYHGGFATIRNTKIVA